MSTLGKTTTPTWPTFGYDQNTNQQVAILQTVPTGGGFFQSVSFWAAQDGSSHGVIHGVIWDSSGNVLAFGPGVNTTGGVIGSGHVGSTQWWTDTFTTPIFIAGGTQIYIGWQPDGTGVNVDWAYNGNDNSPQAQAHSASGATGKSFAGHTTESPTGAVATYATYSHIAVRRGGAWVVPTINTRRSSAWSATTPRVRRGGVWVSLT